MNALDLFLAQGIAAVKAGDFSTARRLLTGAVRLNPASEAAWLGLGAVLKTPQGRAYCLRQVLALNPAHQAARRGLEAIERIPPAPALVAQPLRPPVPVPVAQVQAPVPAAPMQVGKAPIAPVPSRRLPALGQLLSTTGRLRTVSRVAKYTLVRIITLCLMVAIALFLTIVIINFGGFIDDIFRERIAWTLRSVGQSMRDVPEEQKLRILEQAEQEMVAAYGLEEPFLLRCVYWLWRSVTLSWGEPTRFGTLGEDASEVWQVISERLPNTLLLAGASNLLLFFATVFLALYLSRKHGSLLDRAVVALSPLSSAPNWIHGIILTLIFAVELRLLPLGGKYDTVPPDTQIGYVLVVLKHMILPVAAIFLSMFFQTVYAWRTFFLLHSEEDYVELAEAQGLSPRRIERQYILRPTLPYIITSFTLMLITFWQDAIALEVFFHWPGIGALFWESVQRVTRTTLVGLVMIFAYLLALSVFLLDIIYALVDPRVKVGGREQSVDAAVKKTRWRSRRGFWPFRRRVRVRGRLRAARPEIKSAAPRRAKGTLWQRVKRRTSALKPALWETRRYPSALVGLVIIVALVGVSIYTMIAIPYDEAILRWRAESEGLRRNPRNAKPVWVNLFRRDDLPPTIILNSLDDTASHDGAPSSAGAVSKVTNIVSENMTEVTLSFRFDYPYGGLPQDLAVYFTPQYDRKLPFASLALLTPDGREIELESFSVATGHTYFVSMDSHVRQQNPDLWRGGLPMQAFFAAPDGANPTAVKGTYELRVSGFVFEEDSDLDAEFVLYGQVHGLAGTDHDRRDLTVAMLWGVPVALAFGLVGAVGTSLLNMIIAAAGTWFGGWVDHLVQRINEVNMLLPALPLAMTVYFVYAKSIWLILGVMVLLSIFGSGIKNFRAIFLQVKESSYIEAARVYGASNWRIVFRYLVPRILPVLIPQLVILVPGYVFLEVTLAYLGVSDIYLPTWGKVINDALNNNVFEGNYYWVLEPIALVMVTGLAFAMFGSALERIFEPRLRER